jgi:hypothetical protein
MNRFDRECDPKTQKSLDLRQRVWRKIVAGANEISCIATQHTSDASLSHVGHE